MSANAEFPFPLPHVAVPAIPARPDGDPEALRRLAHACHDASEGLQFAASDGDIAAKKMVFTAPVATRIRDDIHNRQMGQKTLGGAFHTFRLHLIEAAQQLDTEWRLWKQAVDDHADAIAKNRAIDAANDEYRKSKGKA
ncbi:MAG: hypothetical protein AAGC46_12825 [Solirubrobacteraceae bacterium]|nr:hypothetical protein [Patulibacter sp.]